MFKVHQKWKFLTQYILWGSRLCYEYNSSNSLMYLFFSWSEWSCNEILDLFSVDRVYMRQLPEITFCFVFFFNLVLSIFESINQENLSLYTNITIYQNNWVISDSFVLWTLLLYIHSSASMRKVKGETKLKQAISGSVCLFTWCIYSNAVRITKTC